MSRYEVAPLAERNIREIAAYIAEDNLIAASRLVNDIYTAFDLLAEHPRLVMAETA